MAKFFLFRSQPPPPPLPPPPLTLHEIVQEITPHCLVLTTLPITLMSFIFLLPDPKSVSGALCAVGRVLSWVGSKLLWRPPRPPPPRPLLALPPPRPLSPLPPSPPTPRSPSMPELAASRPATPFPLVASEPLPPRASHPEGQLETICLHSARLLDLGDGSCASVDSTGDDGASRAGAGAGAGSADERGRDGGGGGGGGSWTTKRAHSAMRSPASALPSRPSRLSTQPGSAANVRPRTSRLRSSSAAPRIMSASGAGGSPCRPPWRI